MTISKDLEKIKGLIRKARVHKVPRANVLMVELRSDGVIDPEDGETPKPGEELPCAPSILIVWTYDVPYDQFDAFHTFLKDNEADIATEVAELKVGAIYKGTYLQLPGGNPHHTYWGYSSIKKIQRFKEALEEHKGDDLYKNVKGLISFVKDPALSMHRHQRAALQPSYVRRTRRSDPIVDLLAEARGTPRSRARAMPRKRSGKRK